MPLYEDDLQEQSNNRTDGLGLNHIRNDLSCPKSMVNLFIEKR